MHSLLVDSGLRIMYNKRLVDREILPNYRWYWKHRTWPRLCFRGAGIAVVIGSLLLPVITAMNRWDSTWQSRTKTATELKSLLAKWELNMSGRRRSRRPNSCSPTHFASSTQKQVIISPPLSGPKSRRPDKYFLELPWFLIFTTSTHDNPDFFILFFSRERLAREASSPPERDAMATSSTDVKKPARAACVTAPSTSGG